MPSGYGSGWTGGPFDVAGLNYHRVRQNRLGYARRLRRHCHRGKPVVITEFGCGAFDGAAALSPASHSIVQHGPAGPTVEAGHTRNELEQARYLAELLGIYRDAGADGAFVFEFAAPY